MKGRGYAPSALRNFIRDVVAPSYVHTDSAYEEVLGEWEEVCKTYCVPQIASEPHHQHMLRWIHIHDDGCAVVIDGHAADCNCSV